MHEMLLMATETGDWEFIYFLYIFVTFDIILLCNKKRSAITVFFIKGNHYGVYSETGAAE